MTDSEFLAALEDCSLPPSEFTHAAHVRAGYLMVRDWPFVEALLRMKAAIRRYASSLGKEDLYHETITVAFLAAINERVGDRPRDQDWGEFATQNADLLDKRFLLHYYPAEILRSERAKRLFILSGYAETPHGSAGVT